jgi:mannose-1-phosphate guanylyltransferase
MTQTQSKDNYCVIMAGGVGSRFWPMSRSGFPKQFHDVLGTGQTLIQLTYHRFLKICPPENIYVVTNVQYEALVKEQLPALHVQQIILEPARRNTAPCVAYANHKIGAINPHAKIIVAPSDHLILKEDEFVEIANIALKQCETGNLVTLGIKPTRPDTGYGYIQFVGDKSASDKRVKKVKTFTEKPSHELAEQFIDSGDFYWNSGIFIWSLSSINAAFEQHLKDLNDLFSSVNSFYNTPEEAAKIANVYSVCESISIDYGIMEKASNVNVVLSDFGWSDLGTWGSLYTHIEKDKHQNGVIGKSVMLYESSGNVVKAPKDKLVVIQGLNDHIVIDTGDVLLICNLKDEQKIKQMVNDIKIGKGESYV